MNVHSYFELATTLIGWHVANGIAELLTVSGLVLLPFAALLWKNWSDPVRSQSARDAASVSLRRMEVDTLVAAVVIVVAFLPSVPVSRADIRFTEPYSQVPTHAQAPELPYAVDASAFTQIRVPILWWLVYQVASHLTDQVVTVIDGLDNPAVLRASLLRIAKLSITDEGLIAELRQFRTDCYEPALSKYQRADRPPVATDHFSNVDWLGSYLFVRTPGYYRACADLAVCGSAYHAAAPVPGWPTRPGIDVAPGQPQCDVWWADTGLGLRARLLGNLHHQAPWFKRHTEFVIDNVDAERLRNDPDVIRRYEDRILRRMLNQVPRQMVARADREAGLFFNSLGWFSIDGVQQAIASVGALALSALLHIVMELVVVGLPMLQAVLLMLLYVALPLVVPYAALQPGIIVRAAVVLFSLRFLSALWALAEFLDEKLLKAMYPDAMLFEFGGSGTIGDVILGLITLMAYIALPMAWFILLGALSSRSAAALAGSWSALSSRMEQAGGNALSTPGRALQGRRN